MSGGGGGGNTTTVQQSDPWSGVQPYLTSGYGKLDQAANNVPDYYPGKTYADFDPMQTNSQNLAMSYAGGMPMHNMLQNMQGASNYGMNSVYDPESNPVLQQYVQSATRPLNQAYNEQVLPGIQDAAVGTGGLGGSRQGVAEGIASRSLMDATGDVSAGIYNNAYNTGMEAQQRALAMAPQTLGLGMIPSNIYGQIGDQRQAMTQQGINEDVDRYNFNSTADYDRYSQYLNTLQGTPWGGASVTGPDPNASNEVSKVAGGAMSGAATGYMLGGPYGAAAGALGGGLLGLWG